MNKNIEPTSATVNASLWFSNYLQSKLNEKGQSGNKLGAAIGLNRKSIFEYIHLKRSPKLDTVAKIMAYYGEDEIRIPIKYFMGDIIEEGLKNAND